jgi:hypothetical protein
MQPMPPGGSPTALEAPPGEGQSPGMPPQQAMAIMQRFNITRKDAPMVMAALESLEAAGMMSDAPPAGPQAEDPNAQIARSLAG